MRVLLVSDEPPFPARNGVTIPAAAYIKLLREHYDVDLILLEPEDCPFERQLVSATRNEVGTVAVIQRRRQTALKRAWAEAFKGIPTFHGWDYLDQDISGPSTTDFQALFVMPISALDFGLKVRRQSQRLIAAINDCYTAVLRSDPLQTKSPRELTSSLIRRIRGAWMGRIESRLLLACDRVLVQTKRDVEWAATIGGNSLAAKTSSLPNGVDDALLALCLPIEPPPPRVVFITSAFVPLYRDNLQQFHRDVWPLVRQLAPQARLRVVGRGLEHSPALQADLRADKSVELLDFVSNLADIYHGVRVAIAPIHKRYGFINKVAEAFACGIPVVGDPSAFNGMEAAVLEGGGFPVDGPIAFAHIISRLLKEGLAWQKASVAARQFALRELSWQSRLPLLLEAIEG